MIKNLVIILLGPAGSGKTTLTYALGKWLNENGVNVSFVNLDPGVEVLPYKPNVDIRDYVTIKELMVKEGLGPNGAMIRAMEILDKNKERYCYENH